MSPNVFFVCIAKIPPFWSYKQPTQSFMEKQKSFLPQKLWIPAWLLFMTLTKNNTRSKELRDNVIFKEWVRLYKIATSFLKVYLESKVNLEVDFVSTLCWNSLIYPNSSVSCFSESAVLGTEGHNADCLVLHTFFKVFPGSLVIIRGIFEPLPSWCSTFLMKPIISWVLVIMSKGYVLFSQRN